MSTAYDKAVAFGLDPHRIFPGTSKHPCPLCSQFRRKKGEPCSKLWLGPQVATWKCVHCHKRRRFRDDPTSDVAGAAADGEPGRGALLVRRPADP